LNAVTVRLILYATLRQKYNIREIAVESSGSIRDLVEDASKIIGEGFFEEIYDGNLDRIRDEIIFFINGRNIKDVGPKIHLKDEDVVAIFPPIAGG
jgi:sulfur-carrier protein